MTRTIMTALILVPGLAMAQSNDDSMTTTGDQEMAAGTEADMSYGVADSANLIRTRDITGGAVYTVGDAGADWVEGDVWDSVGDTWDQIGEIEDIVLTRDGEFRGIVAEVGGFLDLGDKHVMIPVEDVNLVAVDYQTYAYVTRRTEEQLEDMEGVDEAFWN